MSDRFRWFLNRVFGSPVVVLLLVACVALSGVAVASVSVPVGVTYPDLTPTDVSPYIIEAPFFEFDYLVEQYVNGTCYAVNGSNGDVFVSGVVNDVFDGFSGSLVDGDVVVFSSDNYTLTEPLLFQDLSFFKLVVLGALLSPSGDFAVILNGTSYASNELNRLEINLIDGDNVGYGVQILNGLSCSLVDSRVEDCVIGVQVVNSIDWSENNLFDNVFFENVTRGFVTLRNGTGTDSFIKTEILNCKFDLWSAGAIAVELPVSTSYQCSAVRDLIVWFHAPNQTGVYIAGAVPQLIVDSAYLEMSTGFEDVKGIWYNGSKTGWDTLLNVRFLGDWGESGCAKIDADVQYTTILPTNSYEVAVPVGNTTVSFNHNCLIEPFRSGIHVTLNWDSTWFVSGLNSTGVELTFGTAPTGSTKYAGVTIGVAPWEKQVGSD